VLAADIPTALPPTAFGRGGSAIPLGLALALVAAALMLAKRSYRNKI